MKIHSATVHQLATLLGTSSQEEVARLGQAFDRQALNTRRVLDRELNPPAEPGWSIQPQGLQELFSPKESLDSGLLTLGRALQATRIAIKDRPGQGLCQLDLNGISAQEAGDKDLSLQKSGPDLRVQLVPPLQLDASRLGVIRSLSELPAQRYAVIGIGGGSDGLQAAQLGSLLEKAGKACTAVISVRTAPRQVNNPLAVLEEGRAYQIGPETTGDGRFLENLPATQRPTFLALEAGDGKLPQTLQKILEAAGSPDGLLAVDTGGDCLYSAHVDDQATATPDQDLTVLKALAKLPQRTTTAVVACGIDSPRNAQEVLEKGRAGCYELGDSDKDMALGVYQGWKMDGSQAEQGLYGKTVFAWQAAMRGEYGVQALPLPTSAVFSKKNPWNFYARITPFHNQVVMMELADHLKAIGADRD